MAGRYASTPRAPYAGLSLTDGGGRTLRAGVGWSLGPILKLDLEGTRREAADDESDHAMMVRGTMRW